MDEDVNWPDVLRALTERITSAQERFWERVDRQVEEIIEVTEEAGLASGEIITIVAQRAEEQAALMEAVVKRFEGDRRRDLAAVERKGDLGRAAVESLQRQMERVEHSQQLTTQIGELAGSIGKIALGARVLTLNGQAEAARVGAEGRPFAVIVDQLRELSAGVEAANKAIAALATDLGRTIPRLSEGSKEVLRITEQIMSAKDEAALGHAAMGPLLQQSRATSADIHQRTQEIMVQLQAQDWLSQRLRALTPLKERFGRALDGLFARLLSDELADPAEALRLLQAPPRRSAPPPEPAEPCMQPGESLMF